MTYKKQPIKIQESHVYSTVLHRSLSIDAPCVFSMVWYNIVMQRSLVVYHGIFHLSLVFSWSYHENTSDS